ncbi:hypothetical protein [Natronolimnobius sp. AArcel1]|nr:hypothetical protein [Natronolimnobius sp. AArcel1]
MVGRLVALFVFVLLVAFLIAGPTFAETTAAGVCEFVLTLEC